jgi:hypothetical protein
MSYSMTPAYSLQALAAERCFGEMGSDAWLDASSAHRGVALILLVYLRFLERWAPVRGQYHGQ